MIKNVALVYDESQNPRMALEVETVDAMFCPSCFKTLKHVRDNVYRCRNMACDVIEARIDGEGNLLRIKRKTV
ncbi:MAG: hypothetical protein AOA66_0162 [Candidatus Bathyarchaeota archaeon BA2]|nr:MAG: hypothetical protein AOA66_0162 [Candidatus Bathyarchaeota archaeon BA2]